MAKCLRVVGQGVPVRVSNEEAFQMVVRDGDGEYCSKSFFKNWHRPKTAEAQEIRGGVKKQRGRVQHA